MATTMLHPPEELAGAELVALVLPFDEDVDRSHPDAPLRYRRGDIHMPRKPVPLRETHDGPQIGWLSGFVTDRSGIWARVKLGRTGEALVAEGVVELSAEIDDGEITGASLVLEGRPAFASARLYRQGAALDAPRSPGSTRIRLGFSPGTGALAFGAPTESPPTRVVHPAQDIGEHERGLHELSMAAVDEEIAFRRRRFVRRQEELAREPLEREAGRLVAEGVPVALWPPHLPERQSYDAFLARTAEAARAAEIASEIAERVRRTKAELRTQRAEEIASEIAERVSRAELELAMAADPPARRRWWHRIARRRR